MSDQPCDQWDDTFSLKVTLPEGVGREVVFTYHTYSEEDSAEVQRVFKFLRDKIGPEHCQLTIKRQIRVVFDV